ncbi:MAG: hypothetical protein M3T96_07845 [Acidobacteriota bacterium]|nr:hypothetical protein [Acidobacteriota bacterium]
MEIKDSQNLAERIAELLLFKEKRSDDFLRSSLEEFNERLSNIEVSIAANNPKSKIQNPKSSHFSQEKFTNLEELAEPDSNLKDEKACPYEPTGKPCDHCAMCNSRGF